MLTAAPAIRPVRHPAGTPASALRSRAGCCSTWWRPDDRTAVDGPVSATRSCMRATGRGDECSVENQTWRA